jgi:hypothetical protein
MTAKATLTKWQTAVLLTHFVLAVGTLAMAVDAAIAREWARASFCLLLFISQKDAIRDSKP